MGQAVWKARRVLRRDIRQAAGFRRSRAEPGVLTPQRRTEGQATVEAALTLPVVLLALLVIVQVGLVVRDALAVQWCARVGARTAAITADDQATREAVHRAAAPLEPEKLHIHIRPAQASRTRSTDVTVEVRYHVSLRLPIVSRMASRSLPLSATATMRSERTAATPSPTPPP
ncbi:MAG TPA: TadE/TadG family type IV pilus assembly protein [Actinomycetota bacterium]|nr:TadE/TadG family type IV pilus assembly protein [Actinomycetota bacterium]